MLTGMVKHCRFIITTILLVCSAQCLLHDHLHFSKNFPPYLYVSKKCKGKEGNSHYYNMSFLLLLAALECVVRELYVRKQLQNYTKRMGTRCGNHEELVKKLCTNS